MPFIKILVLTVLSTANINTVLAAGGKPILPATCYREGSKITETANIKQWNKDACIKDLSSRAIGPNRFRTHCIEGSIQNGIKTVYRYNAMNVGGDTIKIEQDFCEDFLNSIIDDCSGKGEMGGWNWFQVNHNAIFLTVHRKSFSL